MAGWLAEAERGKVNTHLEGKGVRQLQQRPKGVEVVGVEGMWWLQVDLTVGEA